ncbi:MAG TPA: Na+/H+ antiporter [Gaiella sp.]|uniref:Na+/H+ antiporter n=1 Tax=Gaiella sp. TaxID=2663207 RepID=UPI002D8034FC|nr:Na+/H+ antiporter [Gaiella sp.]HET9288858.1 Na+/H+ antiporter [Gaiella sp.]
MIPLASSALVLEFGREQELQLLALLVSAAALLILAGPLRIPYPILLVLGGLLLGFGPGVPKLTMPPELVLVGILPPLLYVQAYFTGLRELRQNIRPISLLAVGLVGLTTVGVAVVAHAITDLGWAESFVLGAVVSPTDPIAATAIGKRLGVPRRLIDIVEGESLVNDGTALVLLRTAIVAAVAGSFAPWDAAGSLVLNVVGGIAVGLAVGYVIRRVRRPLDNPPLEVTIAFLTGYFAFLPASALGVSGVLAVVTAGVYMGWYTPELTTVQTRLQARGFWEIVTFLLNVLLFGLVGLQLRPILDGLSGRAGWALVSDAVVIVLAVIALRIIWVFPATYVPRWLFPGIRERDPAPPWRHPAFIAWNGMRGAVTIAAALLVPLETDTGAPFAGRDLIVFFAFAVVLATLVVQGLSLPLAIRWLRLEADESAAESEEAHARVMAAEAALHRLDELVAEGRVLDDSAQRLRGQYRFRIDRFSARSDPDGDGKIERRSIKYQRVRRELLEAERDAVVGLRNAGEISDEVMRRIEGDLDLEVSRLDS